MTEYVKLVRFYPTGLWHIVDPSGVDPVVIACRMIDIKKQVDVDVLELNQRFIKVTPGNVPREVQIKACTKCFMSIPLGVMAQAFLGVRSKSVDDAEIVF